MEYKEQRPSSHLAGNIKRFWSLEYDATGELAEPETVLPDGCPEMVFNLSDRFQRVCNGDAEFQPATLFAGQMIRSIVIRPTGRVRLFGVRFHPAGASALFNFPLCELTDQILDYGIADSEAVELEEQVNVAGSFSKRVELFEAFFRAKLARSRHVETTADHAVRLIVISGGTTKISNLRNELGVSERTLERSFRRSVGISPKMLSRIVRFQRLLELVQNAKTPGFLEASLEQGYFDQSHAIREFREFSGTTPLAYVQTNHVLSDVFTASGQSLYDDHCCS